MYWNISTVTGGMSTWGWPQNSLVTVDAASKTFRYNHDYYLLKHLTHFVEAGAKTVEVSGTCDDALAFVNPDNTMVLLVRNALPRVDGAGAGARQGVFRRTSRRLSEHPGYKTDVGRCELPAATSDNTNPFSTPPGWAGRAANPASIP